MQQMQAMRNKSKTKKTPDSFESNQDEQHNLDDSDPQVNIDSEENINDHQ